VVRLVGVAQTRQHVCDRIGHGHDGCSFPAVSARADLQR